VQRLSDGTQREVLHYDEIQHYIDGRYLSASEAYWRIAQFKLQEKSHVIVTLPVHLPDQQSIMFVEDEEGNALAKAEGKNSRLTGFFQLMKKYEKARHLRYHELPQYYRWDAAASQWVERKQLAVGEKTIGRMYTVSPNDAERFYLRLLLLNVSGPQSFDDLKTVDGVICETFRDAAAKRELLLDDQEYRYCLEEAIFYQMSSQLRELFAIILVFGTPSNPLQLWTTFSGNFCDDCHKHYKTASIDDVQLMCYDDVNELLSLHFKSLSDFGIDRPSDAVVSRIELSQQHHQQVAEKAENDYGLLKEAQKGAVDSIMAAVDHTTHHRCFFLDGPGGTGKTFVYNTLCGKLATAGSRLEFYRRCVDRDRSKPTNRRKNCP